MLGAESSLRLPFKVEIRACFTHLEFTRWHFKNLFKKLFFAFSLQFLKNEANDIPNSKKKMQVTFDYSNNTKEINLVIRFEKYDLTLVKTFSPEDVWDVDGKNLKRGWFAFARGRRDLPPGFLSDESASEVLVGCLGGFPEPLRLPVESCTEALQQIRNVLGGYYTKLQPFTELAREKHQLQQDFNACERELSEKVLPNFEPRFYY